MRDKREFCVEAWELNNRLADLMPFLTLTTFIIIGHRVQGGGGTGYFDMTSVFGFTDHFTG